MGAFRGTFGVVDGQGSRSAILNVYLGPGYFQLQRDATVVDVGANIGDFSIQVAKLCPAGLIYAVEPVSANLKCLQRQLELNATENVVVIPIALGGQEFDDTQNFPTAADSLPALPLERWGPLLFTSLSPALPFNEWIAPIDARVSWMPLEDFRRDPKTSRDYLIGANWALYCDNYLEEFHIPYVHAGLAEQLDYNAYYTELFSHGSLQMGIARPGEPVFDLPETHPDFGKRVAAFYFWLFPNIMLNFYPWGLSVNVVTPLGPARTRVSFVSYVWNESLRDQGVGADLHKVEMEDEEVVESVQRGVSSRLYDRGRFSARREIGTHHFHHLLAKYMNGSDGV